MEALTHRVIVDKAQEMSELEDEATRVLMAYLANAETAGLTPQSKLR